MTSRVLLVVVLALAGLALAAGVTFAASRLVGQPIGLSEDQRSLEDSLAPPRTVTVTRTITKADPAPVKNDDGRSSAGAGDDSDSGDDEGHHSGGDDDHGDDDDD
jgi:hypothetical protein